MKKYEKPNMMMESFDIEDVITASSANPQPSIKYEQDDSPLGDIPIIL